MQERTIFLTALEFKTPEARAAFLDEQCAQDAALRRRIEALLKAHEQQGGVVDAMIGSNEPTSSMHSLKEDAPPQPAVDPEDLNFLGPSTTPGCLGSLGPYEVIEVIGRGGMGLVFKARDTKLQRIVAIKVLAPEIAANKTAKKRFEREAQAAAAVSHDHIVTIHAVDEFNNLPYLVMECIVGHSLQQKIEETGPLELKEILRIGMQAALGLAAAHKQGLVHRDIKPANILLQNGIQRVKITDFGLARATDDVGMTHTGQIAGTPMYMSPEQAQGQRVDHLSDLFSLGSVLYTMCTGRPAFRAPNIVAVLRRVCDDTPRPILEVNSELPDWLIAIVNKLLSKKKEDRYQTAAEVAELLSEHLSRLQEPRSGQMVTPPSSLLKNVAWTARPSENQLESDGRGVHPTGFQQAATASVAAVVRDTVRPQSPALLSGTVPPRRKWLLAAVGAVALVMLGVIIITITNKDGTKTKIEVPGDAKVEVTTDKASRGRKPPGSSPVGNTLKAPEGLRPPLAKTGWHGWPTDAPPPAIAPFDAEQAKQHQEAWAKYLGVPVEYTNTLGMKFRLIPPGEFSMGSTPQEVEEAIGRLEPYEKNRWTEYIQGEAPQHKVILTQAIYLGMHEVRQANYKQVMGNNPSHFTTTGPDKLLVEKVVGMDTTQHPVEGVNWSDVTEFCTKLGQREKLKPLDNRTDEAFHPLTGTGYRLPTEAEWEFACRAGTSTRFWSGEKDEDLARAGWCMRSSDERTHPVGELQANPFGLFDVHGNVWEWMQDWWDPTYYGQFSEKPAIAPSGPSSAGTQRVIRGGFWNSYIPHCRAASRNSQEPRWGGHDIGFRVVLSLDAVRQALKLTGPAMPKPVATTPSAPASDFAADRRAAEYVLAIGGSVMVLVNEQDRLCEASTDLPQEPFRLTKVNLTNNQQLNDRGLENFKDCKHLTDLHLHSTPVSDAGLANLQSSKELTLLQLSNSQVSDAGLVYFQDCKKLMSLGLSGTKVTDKGLAVFVNCKKLTGLDLNGTQVTDAGMDNFKGGKDLIYLILNDTRVSDAVLVNFRDYKNLVELHLTGTQVSDAGLIHLKDCKNLSRFWLHNTQVSDAGLIHLKNLKNLTVLVLSKTKVTAAGIDDLKKALPKCKIEWDGGVIEPTAAANSDRRAAAWVLSIGGSINVKEKGQEREIKAVGDLPGGVFELNFVNLNHNQQVSDAGLANFKDCMNLTLLFLGNTKVSDAGLAHFKDCKNLTQLYLSDTQVSDVGLDQFKGRQNLTYLRLAGTRVSDAGLANFKDCKDLMLLELGSPQVSDAGLANFKDCTNLAWLGLDNTQVTNAGIAHFTDWENLAELHLSSAQISDAGLAHLKDCKNLAHLFLAGAQVSDAGLAHLKGCKNLTWLVLLQTKVTAAGIDDLKKALPKCKIEWDGGVIEPTAAARFTNTLGMEFVLVGKGTAWLGGDNGQQGEKKVEMPEDFYLGRYEVTQAEWEQVTGQTPSHFSCTSAVAKTR